MVTFAKYLKGTSGKDTVEGTVGNDHIRGFKGNDLLWGNRAKDKVLGEDGHDTLLGGTGDDTLLGGNGNDLLIGSDDALMNPFRDKYKAEASSKRETDNDRLIGGNGDDKIFGGKGKDFLSGGQGQDRMYGGGGSDRMFGGTGNDRMLGGAGNDIMVGNSGNDIMQGGDGNDTLRYILRQNNNAVDNYSGNSGVDTLQLEFTKAEWARADIKQDVLAFARFMAAHTDSGTGKADSAAFTFSSFGLTASSFEKVKVKVSGVLTPILTAEDDKFTVQEDSVPVVLGSVLDNDFGAEGVAVVSGPAQGSLTLDPATGDITFDTSSGFVGLSAGDTRDVSFDYRIFAANGASQDATATITVHGVNDAPTLEVGTLAATEDGPSVTLDLATLGDDADGDDTGSTLTYEVSTNPASGSVSISGTTLTFAPGVAFQGLALGQTRIVKVGVTATDAHGATATSTVDVTVTGTNDAPVVSAINAGTVTEDDATKTINLLAGQSDVDNNAALTAIDITAVDQNGAAVAFTDNGNGSISIDPSQFGALNDGEAATVTVSYNVSDGIADIANTATLVVNGVTDPTVLTFEDITSDDTRPLVENGYGGLNWSGARVMHTPSYVQDSGYARGTTSGESVAFNTVESTVTVSDPVDEFDFVGVTLTAAWNDNLNIDVIGFRDGVQLYSRTVVVSDDGPTPFTFNWEDVDQVSFQSYGGTDAGTSGSGTYFAMDDFIFI